MGLIKDIGLLIMGLGVIVLCIVLCCGIFSPKPYDEATAHVEIVENITRVFMHDTNIYSFYVENGEKLTHVQVRHSMSNGTKVALIQDVPKDKKMWAVIKNSGRRWRNLEIHLHSSKSVEGGGRVAAIE